MLPLNNIQRAPHAAWDCCKAVIQYSTCTLRDVRMLQSGHLIVFNVPVPCAMHRPAPAVAIRECNTYCCADVERACLTGTLMRRSNPAVLLLRLTKQHLLKVNNQQLLKASTRVTQAGIYSRSPHS
jgi:hypothetical protein